MGYIGILKAGMSLRDSGKKSSEKNTNKLTKLMSCVNLKLTDCTWQCECWGYPYMRII